jgi:hypothetical protein
MSEENRISIFINTDRGSTRPRRRTNDLSEAEISSETLEAEIEFQRDQDLLDEESEDSNVSYKSEDNMTTSDDDSTKSGKGSGSRIPKFRKDGDWDMFEHKFLAYAEDKNFIDVIETKHQLMPETFDGDLTVITDKKVRKVLKQNRKAVLAFSEALGDSPSVFTHFKTGKTKEYPKGLAWKMWHSLKATYDIKDTVTSRELRQKMREITMTKKDNPLKIANELSAIQQDSIETDRPISDAEAIAHFTAVLPFFYASLLQVHETTMRATGQAETVQSIGTALHPMYRQSQMQRKKQGKDKDKMNQNKTKSKGDQPSSDNEIALNNIYHSMYRGSGGGRGREIRRSRVVESVEG